MREIAEATGRGLGVPSTSIAAEDADERFSFLGPLLALERTPPSSELTRQWLDWLPSRPGLIEDLEQGHSFEG